MIKSLDIDKVYAEVDSNNINSQKLLTKCSFKKEDQVKKNHNNLGEVINLELYNYVYKNNF